MSKTYVQIQKQIAALQREADKLKRAEVDGVIAKIKEAIQVYALTAADLGLGGVKHRAVTLKGTRTRRASADQTAAPKFQDKNGNTWGGRGPRPQWLRDALAAGAQLADFAV